MNTLTLVYLSSDPNKFDGREEQMLTASEVGDSDFKARVLSAPASQSVILELNSLILLSFGWVKELMLPIFLNLLSTSSRNSHA